MNFFTMSRDRKYIIYGAGGNCLRLLRLFRKAGYAVSAILDQRADAIQCIEAIPVFTPDRYAEDDTEKERTVIIITIKNVFAHIMIVRGLIAAGYKNIIYKPFPILQGEHSREWDSIDYAYEMLVEKPVLDDFSTWQVACSRKENLFVLKDELLIKEDENTVLCWMPVELLCNYDRDDAFQRIPMGAYYPLVDLYRYLLNTGTDNTWCDIENNFLLYCAEWLEKENKVLTDSLKSSMLHSRIAVFDEMQKKADIDKDFFMRNAVTVERINSVQFCLSASGRNRVCFLIARGYRFVPVLMKKEDYREWMHASAFAQFQQYLEKENIGRLFTAVQHPMAISLVSSVTDYVHLFCLPVVKEIYQWLHWRSAERKNRYFKINKEKYIEEKNALRIVSAVKDEGCINRLLRLYGFQCYCLSSDECEDKISGLIDTLLGISPATYATMEAGDNRIGTCRIAVVDSRADLSFLEFFAGNIVFYLDWEESEGVPDPLSEYTEKKLLFRSIWQGKKVRGRILNRTQDEMNL